jgi:transcriptional regulator GlxA family with amidase domain
MRALVLTASAIALAIGLNPPSPSLAQPSPATVAVQRGGLVLPAPKAGRARPLVVVVADQAGAETTDFIIPYGVLQDSGVAQVRALSTGTAPIPLMPTLKVRPDQTTAQFDAAEPAGADIVIVPAQMKPKSPELAAWIQAQSAKGAVVVSICEGARVLANAGLLKGKRATTHWSALQALGKAYPDTTWVRDRRYVQDGRVITTTGVAASIPASLALVEAIGGPAVAQATARRLGVSDWGPAHRTADFDVTAGDYAQGLGALAAVWTHETLETPLADGTDEIALALRSDAWSRNFRSKVVATGAQFLPVRPGPAAVQFEATLADMGRRYGPHAVRLAKLGMEYDAPVTPLAAR